MHTMQAGKPIRTRASPFLQRTRSGQDRESHPPVCRHECMGTHTACRYHPIFIPPRYLTTVLVARQKTSQKGSLNMYAKDVSHLVALNRPYPTTPITVGYAHLVVLVRADRNEGDVVEAIEVLGEVLQRRDKAEFTLERRKKKHQKHTGGG